MAKCVRVGKVDAVSTGSLGSKAMVRFALRDQIEVIAPNIMVLSEEHGDWEDSRQSVPRARVSETAHDILVLRRRCEHT